MRSLQALGQIASRGLRTSAQRGSVTMKQSYTDSGAGGIVPADNRYRKIQQVQSQMLADTEHMVWQKRGSRDSMPFMLTATLCAVGLAVGLGNLWTLSWPQNQE